MVADALIAVDLSTELAEGFVLPPAGIPLEILKTIEVGPQKRRFHARHGMQRFDDELFPYITSAHLCCGAHGGDSVVLSRLVPRLIEHGVQLGAHPSYPDVFAFGQDRVELSHLELVCALMFQFGALQGVLSRFGERIRHVKCHGALAFDVAYEPAACAALIEAIERFDERMVFVSMAGSPSATWARDAGLLVVEEGFADRGYNRHGRLVPRDHPGALLTDSASVIEQVVAMATGKGLLTVEGERIDLRARTFCLHSDTPSAGRFGAELCAALRSRGFSLAPLAALV